MSIYRDVKGIRRSNRRATRYRLVFGAHLVIFFCLGATFFPTESLTLAGAVWLGALGVHFLLLVSNLLREQRIRWTLGEKLVDVPMQADHAPKRKVFHTLDGEALEIADSDARPFPLEQDPKHKRA